MERRSVATTTTELVQGWRTQVSTKGLTRWNRSWRFSLQHQVSKGEVEEKENGAQKLLIGDKNSNAN